MNETPTQNDVSLRHWWDKSMDAATWSQVENLSPVQAAMLLCGFNPNRQTLDDAETCTNNQIERGDIRRLLNVLEGTVRSLESHYRYAAERDVKMHPWVALWFAKDIACPPENTPNETGVSTRNFCDAFGDLVTGINLSKAMSDNAMWTRTARLTTGTPGGKHRTTWNPVVLAMLLHEKKSVPLVKIGKVFSGQAFLKPWREEWKMFSED